MKNTLESKKKFFAQYWGQKKIVKRKGFIDRDNKYPQLIDEFDYLELKPLSQISDEGAIFISNILSGNYDKVVRLKNYLYVTDKYNDDENEKETTRIYFGNNNNLYIEIFGLDENGAVLDYDFIRLVECADYLRSKGYALPYNGITVEEQIEFGWVKLKES